MPHGLLYGASYSNGILSFTDSQGRTICNADIRKYLTFTATENNSSVALKKVGTVNNTYEYKLNNGAWTSYTLTISGRAITLNAGDIIKWRCTNRSGNFSNNNYVQFVMAGKIEASNPVTSIVLYTLNPLSLSGYIYACENLFKGCTALTKAPELPATTLALYCYERMFSGCTSLTQAPDLPATTLAAYCYRYMFAGCTSFTKAPELPATTLASDCYKGMFSGCTSLTQAPELPVMTLASGCYAYMFAGCTSLTQAPELPATTLSGGFSGYGCYEAMFKGCTSLTQVQGLPATTVAAHCCYGMFEDCTSLTQAPDLPATTLDGIDCYRIMFKGCSILHEVHVAATVFSASSVTTNWLANVAPSGDFWCAPNASWTIDSASGIPQGWNRWVYGGTYVEDITLYINGVSKVCQLGTSPFGACYSDNWVGYKSLSEIQSMGYSLSAQESVTLYLFGDAPVTAYKVPYVDDNPDGFTDDMYLASYWTGTTIGYKWMTASELEDQDLYLSQTQNARKPLTFTATENNSSVALKRIGAINGTYAYRLNDGAWTPYNLTANGIAIPLDAGYRVQFYCTNRNTSFTSSKYLQFAMSGKIEASGHTTSILRRKLNDQTLEDYCYQSMFRGCTSLTQAPALPATTLAAYCYQLMFSGCTSLTQAPALDATTLAESCYATMFAGCTSLTQAPALPATTLSNSCYATMFNGCTSLTQAPALPATTLANNCYYAMFNGCTSLTQAPVLSATTLASKCYQSMFNGCTSLTQAPALPATTLEDFCYNLMFADCNSLTQAPALDATTLAQYCYATMFAGCTSLAQAPVLPATALKNHCYYEMFEDCTSLTQAPVLSATTLADGCYRSMFHGCTSLAQAPELPATTLVNMCYMSMFSGCTSISEIRTYATNPTTGSTYGSVYQWLENVSTTGDFYCDPNVTWDTGVSGIPQNWVRHDIADYPTT